MKTKLEGKRGLNVSKKRDRWKRMVIEGKEKGTYGGKWATRILTTIEYLVLTKYSIRLRQG